MGMGSPLGIYSRGERGWGKMFPTSVRGIPAGKKFRHGDSNVEFPVAIPSWDHAAAWKTKHVFIFLLYLLIKRFNQRINCIFLFVRFL
jgi:hypothetical protein